MPLSTQLLPPMRPMRQLQEKAGQIFTSSDVSCRLGHLSIACREATHGAPGTVNCLICLNAAGEAKELLKKARDAMKANTLPSL